MSSARPESERFPPAGSGLTLKRLELGELFQRWQHGRDRAAREQLMEQYLPLARRLARRYLGSQEPFEDLLQVAYLGLLKALDRFDPERGTSFTSFAVPTILGELKRYFRDTGWSMHLPRGAHDAAMKVENARKQLANDTGRSPSVHQLAEYLEMSSEQVLDALEAAAAHHAVSLDAPVQGVDNERAVLADTIGLEDERYELIDAILTVGRAAQELSDRDRLVLTLRFTTELTQRQIAEQVGVSQMQVSRILSRVLTRLEELIQAEAL